MKNFLILSEKIWHLDLFKELKNRKGERWLLINKKEDFNLENLKQINPDKIFIPHWSHIIPSHIYGIFECIVFHMTDLPYGRGGSPLQNLIVRGHKETKISALKVEEGLDTGAVYLKKELSLEGTANDIFIRSIPVIKEMIEAIIVQNLIPEKQIGKPEIFKRRKPRDGNIDQLTELQQVFNYIRMLDCEGYPPAFIETEHFRLEFQKAEKKYNQIKAHVRIIKK